MYLNGLDIIEKLQELKKLDWLGFKLYLVGGCLEKWDTRDIDICIVGDLDEDVLFNNCQEARKIGPFDLYYIGNEKPYSGKDLSKPMKIKAAKSYDRWDRNAEPWPGKWIGKLYWRDLKFPTPKHKNKTHTYTPVLIHDGCNK